MINWLTQHCEELVLYGLILLLVALVLGFFFRTAWGHWHKGKGRQYDRLKDWDGSYKHYR